MKKYLKVFIILFILIIFYLYVANVSLMPKSITLLQGEKLELATLWGVKLKQKETSNPNIYANKDGEILEASSIVDGDDKSEVTEVRKNRYECKFI